VKYEAESRFSVRLGVGGNRNLAATFKPAEKGSLGGHLKCGRPIVNCTPDCFTYRRIANSNGYGERALTRCRKHDLGWQTLADPMGQPQAHQTRRGKDGGSPLQSAVELGQPAIHVPANVNDSQIGTGPKQLGPTPQAAGSDDRTRRNIGPAKRPPSDERVPGVLPLAYRRDRDTCRQLRRQVFEGVDGKVDAIVQQRVVNLPGKQGPAADPGEGNIRD
jgi:hypothetical protein